MSPADAFRVQRAAAMRRGIGWEFDFASWLAVWEASGYLDQRGRGMGRYVMARNGDAGPYSAHNVRIITNEANSREARANHPFTFAEKCQQQIGKGRGWTSVKGRFQVMCGKKYVGLFASEMEAVKAYQAACERHVQAVGAMG